MKKSIHETRLELARCMMSQGYGSRFSKRLEIRINKLKKRINSDKSAWIPSIHG